MTGAESKLDDSVELKIIDDLTTLVIMVENPGRVNFENTQPLDNEHKGLLGQPLLITKTQDGYSNKCTFQNDWKMIPLPMKPNFVRNLKFNEQVEVSNENPVFIKFELYILESATDSFIDPIKSGFTKGVIFVNGRNLGRYWSLGPQETLYLPGPWLEIGINEIIVFDEVPTKTQFSLHFSSVPKLGPKNKRPS